MYNDLKHVISGKTLEMLKFIMTRNIWNMNGILNLP